jgi:hypothetical protein
MSRRFSRLFTLIICAVFAGSVVTAVGAADRGRRAPMDPRGEPSGLKKGVTECFKVWHNDDGWHVRVVNGRGSRDHKYQGTITVENGVFENVQSHLAKKNGAEKQWRQGSRKTELTFDFSTDEREDGINFKTSRGASAIRFSLKIDGKEVPQQIYVGGRGDHPDTSTFTVAAHPTNKSVERVSESNKSGGIK